MQRHTRNYVNNEQKQKTMNKELSTNSEALNTFLFDGTDKAEDKPIFSTIERLKRASLTCSELSVMVEYENPETLRQRLAEVNDIITETRLTLQEIQRDFAEQPKFTKIA